MTVREFREVLLALDIDHISGYDALVRHLKYGDSGVCAKVRNELTPQQIAMYDALAKVPAFQSD